MTEYMQREPRPDIEGALAALKRAAQRAREEAIRTHTNLVVVRDGKLVIYSPADEDQKPDE